MTSGLRDDSTAFQVIATLLAPLGPPDSPLRTSKPRRYLMLPNAAHPRYLAPTDRRFARSVKFRPATAPAQRVTKFGLQLGLRLGLGRLAPNQLAIADGDSDSPSLRRAIEAHLEAGPIDIALAVGAPRANRKPILQIISPAGETVAWAKIGIDDHTGTLVQSELATLQSIGRQTSNPRTFETGQVLVVPTVRGSFEWRGQPVMILKPLAINETAGDLELTTEVIRAIAGDIEVTDPTASRWWKGLRALADPDHHLTRLLDVAEVLLEGNDVPLGRWHGDLAPWNASWEHGRLVVWDWERSEVRVPVGLDLLHNRLQVALLRAKTPLLGALRQSLRSERANLEILGWAPSLQPALAIAYLATIRGRYLHDSEFGSLGAGEPIARAIDHLDLDELRAL